MNDQHRFQMLLTNDVFERLTFLSVIEKKSRKEVVVEALEKLFEERKQNEDYREKVISL